MTLSLVALAAGRCPRIVVGEPAPSPAPSPCVEANLPVRGSTE